MAYNADDCGFQILNNDEIVTSVLEKSNSVNDETVEDEDYNNGSSKGPLNSDAFSALETAMEGYEQQSECYPTRLQLLKRVRDLAAKKRSYRFHMLHGSRSVFGSPNGVRSQLIRINELLL
ncbi:uncharacterized protein TNCV_4124471 [Trichonephila clavipes]|nr:uncharacterized protein TNCV_4124471 [Trichonephila clavipes]